MQLPSGIAEPSLATLPHSLEDWLSYQQQQHPTGIDLGLARAGQILGALQKLNPAMVKPAPLIITIAGTNGKGSTVAFLRAMLQDLGFRVGSYDSPHILQYQERISLADRYVEQSELLAAFQVIETAARAERTTLTFFEYNTLAALWIFAQAKLDVVILEVGLGGRLDAVNLIDADAVILTTVDLDHQLYLGNTRELIGREKAGVFRANQIAVYADREPVNSVLEHGFQSQTILLRPTRDYLVSELSGSKDASHFCYQYKNLPSIELQRPNLRARCQTENAAACLTLLLALQEQQRLRCPLFTIEQLQPALLRTQIHGRLSQVGAKPAIYFDVAHNPQAAGELSEWLYRNPILGRTRIVFGALEDKDVVGVVTALQKHAHAWYLCGLNHESQRGLSAMELVARVRGSTLKFKAELQTFDEPKLALAAAMDESQPHDRILMLGSFFIIAAGYRALGFESLPWLY